MSTSKTENPNKVQFLADKCTALLCENEALRLDNERLRTALQGVVAIADRKTVEFQRARDALAHKALTC